MVGRSVTGMAIGQNVRRWIVSVSQEDTDPYAFGPYTERKARELADAFNEQIECGLFDGEGWIHAGAYPIRNPQSITRLLAEYGKTPLRKSAA